MQWVGIFLLKQRLLKGSEEDEKKGKCPDVAYMKNGNTQPRSIETDPGANSAA
jgi:hypothetical protein